MGTDARQSEYFLFSNSKLVAEPWVTVLTNYVKNLLEVLVLHNVFCHIFLSFKGI